MKQAVLALVAVALTGCGYHVTGHADVLPEAIHTIAVPQFTSTSVKYKIGDKLTQAVTREFIQRTRYHVVPNPDDADAVLTGTLVNYVSYPTTFDPGTGRASGVQVIMYIAANLKTKDGKVLFDRPNFEIRERYEISVDPKSYFDESSGAFDRLSRDVARTIVSAVLEKF